MLMQYKLPEIEAKLILFKAKELSDLFKYDALLIGGKIIQLNQSNVI